MVLKIEAEVHRRQLNDWERQSSILYTDKRKEKKRYGLFFFMSLQLGDTSPLWYIYNSLTRFL